MARVPAHFHCQSPRSQRELQALQRQRLLQRTPPPKQFRRTPYAAHGTYLVRLKQRRHSLAPRNAARAAQVMAFPSTPLVGHHHCGSRYLFAMPIHLVELRGYHQRHTQQGDRQGPIHSDFGPLERRRSMLLPRASNTLSKDYRRPTCDTRGVVPDL
jgi:hypothetical protein